VKISLLFEQAMVKILTFFLLLVFLSYYLGSVLIFLPLDLIQNLESVFGYVGIGITALILIWLMGD